jgi:hypothetical protein
LLTYLPCPCAPAAAGEWGQKLDWRPAMSLHVPGDCLSPGDFESETCLRAPLRDSTEEHAWRYRESYDRNVHQDFRPIVPGLHCRTHHQGTRTCSRGYHRPDPVLAGSHGPGSDPVCL